LLRLVHRAAAHRQEHRLDLPDGLGRELPQALVGVVGAAVQGDAAQFAAVEDVTRTVGPFGDLLGVDAAGAVQYVLPLQGADRPQGASGAGVDLAEVQAAGCQGEVAPPSGLLEGDDEVAGAVQVGAAVLGAGLAGELVEHLRDAGDGGGAEAPSPVALAYDV